MLILVIFILNLHGQSEHDKIWGAQRPEELFKAVVQKASSKESLCIL